MPRSSQTRSASSDAMTLVFMLVSVSPEFEAHKNTHRWPLLRGFLQCLVNCLGTDPMPPGQHMQWHPRAQEACTDDLKRPTVHLEQTSRERSNGGQFRARVFGVTHRDFMQAGLHFAVGLCTTSINRQVTTPLMVCLWWASTLFPTIPTGRPWTCMAFRHSTHPLCAFPPRSRRSQGIPRMPDRTPAAPAGGIAGGRFP